MHTAAIGTRVKICCILMTEKAKMGTVLEAGMCYLLRGLPG